MDGNIASTSHHQFIPLAKLTASPLNHRKTFDKTKMDELAESIRSKGILQPILARPLGEAFEVVAGERRFRAAKAAKLVDIPAIVRAMSDTEALEIQVIENGQRVDPHPLEEAEGYEALLACTNGNGEKYMVDHIAAKVGKSKAYVYARIKLLALCPEARKAFHDGELDASQALLVARIGHHDTQRAALKDVTKGEYGRGPMSYREAHQHILQNYMLKLSAAPFDIKDVQLVAKAGACGPCPKRTGNQPELFGDVKSADVCTDPKCFDGKRQAHYAVAAKTLETEGFKVITGEAAKKALPQWEHERGGSYLQINGYKRLEDTSWEYGRTAKVSAIMGRDFKPTKLQHPLTGEIFDVASTAQLQAAAKKAQSEKPTRGASKANKGPFQRKRSDDEILSDRLLGEIFKKLPAEPGRREWQYLVDEALMAMDGPALIADELVPRNDGKRHDHQSGDKALKAAFPKMPLGDVARVVVACAIAQRCYGLKQMSEAAKLYKIDTAKVKKDLAEAKAAEKKPAKKPAPAKKAKKA